MTEVTDAKQFGEADYEDQSLREVSETSERQNRWNIDCYDLFDKCRYPGKFIIFNHIKFADNLVLSKRHGTEEDAKRVEKTLKNLGFQEAAERQNDLEFDDIKEKLNEVLEQDFSDYGCIIVVILTHGELRQLYAYDMLYDIEEIKQLFNASNVAQKLATKPKIFLVQACQGDQVDDGVYAEGAVGSGDTDFGTEEYSTNKIPITADFLIAFSSAPGYVSFRNKKGSWFIQTLCDAIDDLCKTIDFENIMTLVKYDIAYNKTSYSLDDKLNCKKQIPEISSTLTKKLCLTIEAKQCVISPCQSLNRPM